MYLNHPELVHKHPAHLASPVNMLLEKVRYSRTTRKQGLQNLFEPSRTTSLLSSGASNLLEPYHCRDSKVCRVLTHEFGVVRLYRTFSNFIFTVEARCAG